MRPVLTRLQGAVLRALTAEIAGKDEPSAKQESTSRQTPSIIVESFDSIDWASLTFAGQRHRIVLRCTAEAARRAAVLDAADLAIAGSIVAEFCVITSQHTAGVTVGLTIEVLTIRDGG